MSENNSAQVEVSAAERDADSRADMYCSVGVVLLAWATAVYWMAGL